MSIVLEYSKDADSWFARDEDDDGGQLVTGRGSDQVKALIDLAERLDREWQSALDLTRPV